MFIIFYTWNNCGKLFFCSIGVSVSVPRMSLVQECRFVAPCSVNHWVNISSIKPVVQSHLGLYLILHICLLLKEKLYQSFYHPMSKFVQWKLSWVTSPFGPLDLPLGTPAGATTGICLWHSNCAVSALVKWEDPFSIVETWQWALFELFGFMQISCFKGYRAAFPTYGLFSFCNHVKFVFVLSSSVCCCSWLCFCYMYHVLR